MTPRDRAQGRQATRQWTARHLDRRPVFITAFVAALASGMTGCSYSGEYTAEQKAARAKSSLDQAAIKGQYTQEWYDRAANDLKLPREFVSEAQDARAFEEARRAGAFADRMRADADVIEQIGRQDAELRQALTQQQIARAEADKTHKVFESKLTEMNAQASARESAFAAESRRKDAHLAATIKEWQSEIDKLRAQALTDWTQAQALHGQMLAERAAVEQRGNAELAQMIRVADLTQERAEAKSRALRTEAQTVGEQTMARVTELDQQIRSLGEKTSAAVSELRQRATSLESESAASVSEMRARAKSLEEQDIDQTFSLRLKAAEAKLDQDRAEAERLFQAADAMQHSTTAEVARILSDAQKQLEIDRTAYDEARVAIDSYVQHGKAEIAVARVEAMRLEKDARSEFIKAEAEARANAVRETSKHQHVLAEEQYERLKAQAEQEASRIATAYAEALNRQTKKGATDLPANRKQKVGSITSEAPAPTMPTASNSPAVLEPEHVARFKATLAAAAKFRTQADADERSLFATAQERQQKFDAWWSQQQTRHEAMIAQANALQTKGQAEIARMTSQADSKLRTASAVVDRSRMEAEALKREDFASIATLRARADADEKKAIAAVGQLRAQAEVTERNGQSELRALQVVRDTTRQRGESKVQRLIAEANSLEQSQRAVVAQMRAEIESGRQILSSELARLNQTASSYLAIAQATHQESVTQAETLARITEANSAQARAGHEADRQIAAADVQYMRDMTVANELVAQASVSRMLADGEANFAIAQSQDGLSRVQIAANRQINEASVQSQLAAASAHDETTRAVFASRIALTEAERNRAYAALYQQNLQNNARTQQAQAAAKAYREVSNNAVARLRDAGTRFESAAKQNWYSELAIPASYPSPDSGVELSNAANGQFNNDPASFPSPRPTAFNPNAKPDTSFPAVKGSATADGWNDKFLD